MKKILFLLVSVGLPVVLHAQSTCETRVDAHQHATTMQRVAYCLTPESVAPDNTYSRLIFSGISQYNPPTQSVVQPSQYSNAKQGTFHQNKVSVSRTYVGTTQFPQVFGVVEPQPVQVVNYAPDPYAAEPYVAQPAAYVNSVPVVQTGDVVVVQQPGIYYAPVTGNEFAYVSSPTVPARYSTSTVVVQSVPEANQADLTNTTTRETKAGIKARTNKPGRQRVASTSLPQAEPVTSQVNYSDAPYTYQEDLTQPNLQTQTPPLEVPAQANDPMSVGVNPYTEIPMDSQPDAPVASN